MTRTERRLLEIAAQKHGLDPALELPEPPVGPRPQLGDVLVERGLLSPEQLDDVLDDVFAEIEGDADRLAPPPAAPVPRPSETDRATAYDLEQVVERLTVLLDRLVGAQEGDAPPPAPAADPVPPPAGPAARPDAPAAGPSNGGSPGLLSEAELKPTFLRRRPPGWGVEEGDPAELPTLAGRGPRTPARRRDAVAEDETGDARTRAEGVGGGRA